MRTWTITYKGQLRANRTRGGAAFDGVMSVRATTLEEALVKFYSVFNKTDPKSDFFIELTNITSKDS